MVSRRGFLDRSLNFYFSYVFDCLSVHKFPNNFRVCVFSTFCCDSSRKILPGINMSENRNYYTSADWMKESKWNVFNLSLRYVNILYLGERCVNVLLPGERCVNVLIPDERCVNVLLPGERCVNVPILGERCVNVLILGERCVNVLLVGERSRSWFWASAVSSWFWVSAVSMSFFWVNTMSMSFFLGERCANAWIWALTGCKICKWFYHMTIELTN